MHNTWLTDGSVACQALGLFQRAVEEGHFKQQRWDTGSSWPARAEVNLHAMTAGVAVLSLYTWLLTLKQRLLVRGAGSLPGRLAIVSDKGKSSKEAGNLVVKEAVAAMMTQWESPFRWAPPPHPCLCCVCKVHTESARAGCTCECHDFQAQHWQSCGPPAGPSTWHARALFL